MVPARRLGDRPVGAGHLVYVVAAVGTNHDGDLANAFDLVDRAAETGCDAREVGIAWFASPRGLGSVPCLEELDPVCHRLAAASLTDDALLDALRSTGRTVVAGTDIRVVSEALGDGVPLTDHDGASTPARPSHDAERELEPA